jgi:hypothetical protein
MVPFTPGAGLKVCSEPNSISLKEEAIVPKEPRTQAGSPPLTSEAYENKLIDLAMRDAEEKLKAGKAPTTMVLHFLKLGTTKAALDLERMRAETAAIEAQGRTEELFEEALKAFAGYKPTELKDVDD